MKVRWRLAWWLCLGAAGCAPRAEASRPAVPGAPQLHAPGGDGVAAELDRRLFAVESELSQRLAAGGSAEALAPLVERRLALSVALARLRPEAGSAATRPAATRPATADAAERDALEAVQRIRATPRGEPGAAAGDGWGASGMPAPPPPAPSPTPIADGKLKTGAKDPGGFEGAAPGWARATNNIGGEGGAVQAAIVRPTELPSTLLPAVEGHIDDLLACFASGALPGGVLGVRVSARLAADGSLHDLAVRSDEPLASVAERCLVERLARVRVPGAEELGGVPVSFPLWLRAP